MYFCQARQWKTWVDDVGDKAEPNQEWAWLKGVINRTHFYLFFRAKAVGGHVCARARLRTHRVHTLRG